MLLLFLVNWSQSEWSQIFQEHFWLGQFTHGLKTEIAALNRLPLIIDLHQDRTCQAKDGRLIREYTHYIRSALDLLVETFSGLVK